MTWLFISLFTFRILHIITLLILHLYSPRVPNTVVHVWKGSYNWWMTTATSYRAAATPFPGGIISYLQSTLYFVLNFDIRNICVYILHYLNIRNIRVHIFILVIFVTIITWIIWIWVYKYNTCSTLVVISTIHCYW